MVDDKFIEKYRKELEKLNKIAKESGKIDEKENQKQIENDNEISISKGYILNRISEIEHLLNIYLATYFSNSNIEKQSQFYNLVLSKDFFTLHQKIKLFSEISYHKKDQFENKFEGLTGILHELKDMRNIIAHGFKTHATQPILSFAGNKKIIKLDSKFLKEFNKLFEITLYSLTYLNNYLIYKEQK